MILDHVQFPSIIIHRIEPQTLGSSIQHLNYSEVFSHLHSWCITIYQTIYFYLFIIDHVLLALCSHVRFIHDRWHIYLSVNIWELSICGCESSVLYVTYTCKRGTPHGIYLTYIATAHATHMQHAMIRSDSVCCYLAPW